MDQIYARIVKKYTVPELVCQLHHTVTDIQYERVMKDSSESLATIMGRALNQIFTWLYVNDIDPEALMLEKHEYNKTRPYRHGGKKI